MTLDVHTGMDPDFTNAIMHEGILRKSGRYPWGSGETPHQRNKEFLQYVDSLHKKGLTESEIAQGLGITTTQLRATKTITKNQQKQAEISQAYRLKEKGMSNVAIGEQMGLNESSVRALLNPSTQAKNDVLLATSNMLKDQIKEKTYLDVGAGVENYIGVSKPALGNAIAVLQEEGYKLQYLQVEQQGTGKKTTIKVLTPPDTTYSELYKNQDKVGSISNYSEDGGRTFLGIEPPAVASSKRIAVRYADEGGASMDGVIQLRRGVPDVSLGESRYAQVRINVDGTHYLKGMAMYSDNMPDGIDMIFNTNKHPTGNKLDAMKPLKKDKETGNVDDDNPFGSIVRQKHYKDKSGNEKLSLLNIVGTEDPDGRRMAGEEGAWYQWSRKLSSQMLSKQPTALAKQQLDLAYDIKKGEFDEINALTNPAVKKKLLESFADGADSSAVHLKAAGLPRTRNHVILPINSLKDTEVYAPQYKNGEKVVLIRHPHGGIFEIPELTVNNKNKEANSLIKNAIDAVGINSRVAERLSGADFDGDTVLVIPNNSKQVRHKPTLDALKNFDPKTSYPGYPGMPAMRSKQQEMGNISNLITDMHIKGAPDSEIARAVKHSMVVIDAEKHELNYKQSAADNNIRELKKKYQGRADGGASTIVSRASSESRVLDRKPRSAKEGGAIDPVTGKKMFVLTNEAYVNKAGKTVVKTIKSTKMAETDDAFTLASTVPEPIEKVYATHANKLKALANQARVEYLKTPNIKMDRSAKIAYEPQVKSLNAKLNIAQRNAPLERKAQLLAAAVVSAKRQANPNMEADELKKIKGQALTEARRRTGAKKQRIEITQVEWDAIQAGAISNNRLNEILKNTDLDVVKALATPRDRPAMPKAKVARAQSLLASGYTQAEVAEALGVPTSTLNDALNGKD